MPDELPVLTAEPVTWDVEFRLFVLERAVTTLSIYARDGELARAESGEWLADDAEVQAASDFGKVLLDDQRVELPPAFVMDIGRITGRGWAVIEANPAWASGIYGCDPQQVLPVIQRACVKQAVLTADDQRWVMERLV